MSSEDDQDELEERKGEIWSLDEVRGGGRTGTGDTTDTPEDESTVDTQSQEDKTDTADISDTSDTEDTVNEGASSAMSKTEDNSDTSDTTVATEDESVLQAEGETVRQMVVDAENKGLAVRDLHNVNVYLFESIYHDMRTTFKQLDTEYYETHGEDLSKNKDFFNAVFRAGLQSPQLKEELEIE